MQSFILFDYCYICLQYGDMKCMGYSIGESRS